MLTADDDNDWNDSENICAFPRQLNAHLISKSVSSFKCNYLCRGTRFRIVIKILWIFLVIFFYFDVVTVVPMFTPTILNVECERFLLRINTVFLV